MTDQVKYLATIYKMTLRGAPTTTTRMAIIRISSLNFFTQAFAFDQNAFMASSSILLFYINIIYPFSPFVKASISLFFALRHKKSFLAFVYSDKEKETVRIPRSQTSANKGTSAPLRSRTDLITQAPFLPPCNPAYRLQRWPKTVRSDYARACVPARE